MSDFLYLLGHQAECESISRVYLPAPNNEHRIWQAVCTCQPSVIEVRSGMAFDSETFTFVGRVVDSPP